VTGIATFIANMFILAIAAVLWVVAIAGMCLIIGRVAEEVRKLR